MTLCVFVLIASEFLPVSLLTPIAGELNITEGLAGQGIAISGALAVLTSGYASYSSCRQYRDDLDAALVQTGLTGELKVDKVRQFFNHPGFVTPFADGLVAALGRLSSHDPTLTSADVEVIFTGHSLPIGAAMSSGFGAWREATGGAYLAQHRQVAEQVGLTWGGRWKMMDLGHVEYHKPGFKLGRGS